MDIWAFFLSTSFRNNISRIFCLELWLYSFTLYKSQVVLMYFYLIIGHLIVYLLGVRINAKQR